MPSNADEALGPVFQSCEEVNQMETNRLVVLMAIFASVTATSGEAEARKGWYLDFFGGVETHMDPETAEVDTPEFRADSHASSLFELDVGYSFDFGFSMGLGVELENWIATNMKLDFKYSFLSEERLQPYLYICLHGGIVHWFPLGAHLGAGVDYFVTKRFYIAADIRGGYEAVRTDPELEQHLESAVVLGFGYMLSGEGY
jgi:hypothetical protein